MKEQREKHIKRKGGKIRLHPYRGFWSVSCQRLQASALWSTWHAVATPSLPSKHEGRGGHHDHCLCFNKTLFVELSTEADLHVCCSLSTASQILYWVILVTGFLGATPWSFLPECSCGQNRMVASLQGVGRHSLSRIY